MKTMKCYVMLATLLFAVFAGVACVAQEPASETQAAPKPKRILVMPVLNTAFDRKDKFYGMNEDLSRNLQSFLSFSIEALTDHKAVKTSIEDLFGKYPTATLYPHAADAFADKIAYSALQEAAGEYVADLIVIAETPRAAIEVKGLDWILDAELKVAVYDVASGKVVFEKSYAGHDTFRFANSKDQKQISEYGAVSLSGKPVSHEELKDAPEKFGGLITGYPYVQIVRELCSDINGL